MEEGKDQGVGESLPTTLLCSTRTGICKLVPKPRKGQTVDTKATTLSKLSDPSSKGPASEKKGQDSCRVSRTRQPYEKVNPDPCYHDTWPEMEEFEATVVVPLPMMKRWWSTKEKKKRTMTLIKVLVVLTLIFLTVVVLLSVGLYYMIGRRLLQQRGPDYRLTTKTDICQHMAERKLSEEITRHCVYEIPSDYQKCQGPVCYKMAWTFHYESDHNAEFKHNDKNFMLIKDETNYADCGYLQWCQGGKCVVSNVPKHKWWMVGRNVFPQSEGTWTARNPHDLPCVDKMTRDTKKGFDNMVNKYWNRVDDWCNKDGCANTHVKYGIRVRFYQCELGVDHWSGIRKVPCASDEPFQVFTCHQCPNYKPATRQVQCPDPTDIPDPMGNDCLFKCHKSNTSVSWPNGGTCQGSGVCFYGHCYGTTP